MRYRGTPDLSGLGPYLNFDAADNGQILRFDINYVSEIRTDKSAEPDLSILNNCEHCRLGSFFLL